MAVAEGLPAEEDFFVFFFLNVFFLPSLEELSESLKESELDEEPDEEYDEDEDKPFFFGFFVEDFFLMMSLTLSLLIRPFLASRLMISFSIFFYSFFFSRVVPLPTIFSMYAVDVFDSTPPLATFAPRLAQGLGVVELAEFLFLVIGSLFEHRSTAGIV